MAELITIASRFNGPLDSGQGGYSAGLVAARVDGPAEVSLRRPVPLDTPLAVARGDEGSVRALDGDALVAEAHPIAPLEVDVPAPVSLEDARAGSANYRGQRDGVFSRCFVCGLARDDSFHVFAGEVPGRRVMGTPWMPPAWSAGPDGTVRPEFVWAALDCPATFSLLFESAEIVAMLARFAVRIDAPVHAGREHVVMGWFLRSEGRKQHAASAIVDADGTVLAVSRALLIEPRVS